MTYAYLCDDENIKHLKLDDKLERLWCDGNVKLSNFNFNQKIHMYYE
ncbi:hypothetical protein [Galbibacter sp. BG1]